MNNVSWFRSQALWWSIVLFVVSLALGFWLGTNARGPASAPLESDNSVSIEREKSYSFTNPLLDCELADGIINRELVPFKPAVQELVESYLAKRTVSHLSVYFRDLDNGAWFGIGEKDVYSPASLLKVPVMMAYYKWEQDEVGVLQRQLRLAKKDEEAASFRQFVQSEQEIAVGKEYTVAELVERMITHSDNQANYLLNQNVSRAKLDEVFSLLGVPRGEYSVSGGELTVKQYAAFFRILFNSSLLDRERSEAALKLLNRTDFKAGLVAGVPKSVTVAHKFGERSTSASFKQFHDCGIVYYPGRPYILCIMTQGNDYWQQINVISNISKLVYERVDAQINVQRPTSVR